MDCHDSEIYINNILETNSWSKTPPHPQVQHKCEISEAEGQAARHDDDIYPSTGSTSS